MRILGLYSWQWGRSPGNLVHLSFTQPVIDNVIEMKQFLQIVTLFSALAATKPLHSIQSFSNRRHNGNWTIGQTVSATSGPVQGHAASNASQVSEYLGIPFAQPPTGSLRFEPPVAYNGTSTINGTNYVSLQSVFHFSLLLLFVSITSSNSSVMVLINIMVRASPASKQAAAILCLRVRTV